MRRRRRDGRLGLYNDDIYRVTPLGDGQRVSADRAFLLFACEVGRAFDSLVLLGRSVHTEVPADYVLPEDVELVELPYYDDLRQLRQVAKISIATGKEMWRGLSHVDGVWVLGPHPFAFPLIMLALFRRKKVVLGVRNDPLQYFRARLPNWRWSPLLLGVWLADLSFRGLSRGLPTTVVGSDIARRYGGGRPNVLEMTVSLMRADDVAAAPREQSWSGTIDLLTIGRIDREKSPFVMVEALAVLNRERRSRYRLLWIGRGPLEAAVVEHARSLGVDGQIEFRGYVPFGEALFERYRAAHMFVHTSLTEGVPQVILEALALATPVVATDVGGVSAALDSGGAGLLVRPSNPGALADAILRLSDDEELRARLVLRGLELARENTLETQATRVAQFIAARAGLPSAAGSSDKR